ncbi:peptidoglycan-binding domain-containing protein [Leifsonia sp. C5G2]|uniref:peptidoglycan-binding domain-containing protein n=1 Tax=Leifsonia sp. C5G2 TaxID=2735269 RepID=UPI001584C649|nr:peptidoglycan-binding domain-containing protein [Leifsonia sp. C5G2]NUU05332.1 hypothetical protein [Leifsonia sp. C5G2]
MSAARRISVPRIGLYAIGAITAAALGASGAVLFLAPATPTTLSTAGPATSVPVTSSEFRDERRVELTVAQGPEIPITSPIAGRITRSRCGVQPFESGASSLAVNSVAVVSLATAVPLWRDLALGDTGEDVTALQSELARLGYPVAADGTIGGGTLAAMTKLMRSIGDTAYRSQTVPASRILWIPAPTTAPESCDQSVGSTVEAGGTLATVPGAITALRITRLPEAPLPGERLLALDGQTVPVGEDGAVTDPAALESLTKTATVQLARKSTESSTITAQYRLATPIRVTAVPPTAVFAVGDQKGCIRSGKVSIPVTVVGSQLGETFVLVDRSTPPSTVEIAPKRQPPCR